MMTTMPTTSRSLSISLPGRVESAPCTVKEWLTRINLAYYLPNLQKAGLTTLPLVAKHINPVCLLAVGIDKPAHVRKLCAHAERMVFATEAEMKQMRMPRRRPSPPSPPVSPPPVDHPVSPDQPAPTSRRLPLDSLLDSCTGTPRSLTTSDTDFGPRQPKKSRHQPAEPYKKIAWQAQVEEAQKRVSKAETKAAETLLEISTLLNKMDEIRARSRPTEAAPPRRRRAKQLESSLPSIDKLPARKRAGTTDCLSLSGRRQLSKSFGPPSRRRHSAPTIINGGIAPNRRKVTFAAAPTVRCFLVQRGCRLNGLPHGAICRGYDDSGFGVDSELGVL